MFRLTAAARDEAGWALHLLMFGVISVVSGVLLAGLAVPWVGLLSKGAESSAAAMENFPLKLKFKPLSERTRVLAADGSPLAVFYDENRLYVPLEKVDIQMQQAIVAIEDSRFYDHGALDVKGTLRALFVNQASSGVVQGGSSITQQLVKLTLLENAATPAARAEATERSYTRKLAELRYAVWVEDHLRKNEILEHYLNAAYFGDGAYGVQAAAHHYFSADAADLTLRQAALLAGLVKNPTSYDPTNNEDSARERRNIVLERMRELRIIDRQAARQAAKRPLGLDVTTNSNGCVDSAAPFFCDYLLQYLLASPSMGDTIEERRRRIYGGGLTITSTLDPRFQTAADNSVQTHVDPTDRAIGGLAMVEPRTGYVRALAQSRPMGPAKKKGETFLNYVVPDRYGDSAGFQPGSTFKAFVLTQAIKDGVPLRTEIDSPSVLTVNQSDFKVCGGKNYPIDLPYEVSNSTSSGTMDLYTGTQQSVNTFYIQLEQLTGLCGPWRLAKKMGVVLERPGENMVPALTFGFVDVSPLEMAEAYATFPARGMHCDSSPVLDVRDRDGRTIPTPKPRCNRIMKPAEADAVNDIFAGVQEPGGFGYEVGISLDQPSAGKTGTVAPAKSVWFIGYTPTLTTAAMIAGAKYNGKPRNLDNQVIGGVNVGEVHGSSTAGPMWFDAMEIIQQWLPDRDFVPPLPEIIEGETIPIPSLAGASPATALTELRQLGLKPQFASSVNSTEPFGTVDSTLPESEAVEGQTVLIYTSNGVPPPTASPSPNTTSPTSPTTPGATSPTAPSSPSPPAFTPGTPVLTPSSPPPTSSPPSGGGPPTNPGGPPGNGPPGNGGDNNGQGNGPP